jgi:ferrochelatase
MAPAQPYDAFLLVSFGGPERQEDVIPFLENVLRGKNVPHERMLEVAEHYRHFGGRSPINEQCRTLIAALQAEFAAHGITLPIYWGNRNWQPMLADTVRQMQADGVRRALAFATSAFGSYSGCRQYREDIERTRAEAGPGAPEIDTLPAGQRAAAVLAYTAHSVPLSMARTSPYLEQLQEACKLVSQAVGREGALVFQSRSGPPSQPWLEPDVLQHIRQLHAAGAADIVLAPIGFLSDHMEVVYDLDTEAADLCRELGVNLARALTVGVHPAFIAMLREMVAERLDGTGPGDECRAECCAMPARPRP